MNFVVKVLLVSVLITLINQVAKYNITLGALLKALPLISLISFVWLYYTTNSNSTLISKFSSDTFWLVLPTLPLFPIFSYLLKYTKLGFWSSLIISTVIMIICYILLLKTLKLLGISL